MFKGSIPALITPFKNNKVDFESFQKIIEWSINNGSHGFVPCGTTGESPTLSHQEHKEVIAECVRIVDKRVPVIAGTGSNNTIEAIEFTQHAESQGANAALIVTPYYNKPTQKGLYDHFKKISNSTKLPIIIYNIPGRSVIDMSIETMVELSKLDNIAGVKDATEWVGPWNDEIMKFYEAAKYYYFPGMHEPGSALAAGCNKAWLTSLSNSDQVIIEAAAAMENDVMMAEYNAKNGAALARLVNEQGVIVKEFSDDTFDSFGEAADEVYAEVVQHSDLANRIHESMVKSRTEVGGWLNLGDAAYSRQRNRVLGL